MITGRRPMPGPGSRRPGGRGAAITPVMIQGMLWIVQVPWLLTSLAREDVDGGHAVRRRSSLPPVVPRAERTRDESPSPTPAITIAAFSQGPRSSRPVRIMPGFEAGASRAVEGIASTERRGPMT